MAIFRRILVATDFSPASDAAFELALKLAKSDGAGLLVVHAYEAARLPDLSFAHVKLYEDYDAKLRADAAKALRTRVDRARKENLEAEALVLSGFADEAIIDAAANAGVDLIVMGTQGRRGAARFFLGSVAARVVATARCPVLTVYGEPSGAS